MFGVWHLLPITRVIWTPYGHYMYRFISSLSSYMRRIPVWIKWPHHFNKSRAWLRWINAKVSVLIFLYTLFPRFNIIHNYITGHHMLTSSYIFFNVNISKVFIRCIWLNPTYIMPNLFQITLYCDRDIGPTLRDHKWPVLCSFIFLCRIIRLYLRL